MLIVALNSFRWDLNVISNDTYVHFMHISQFDSFMYRLFGISIRLFLESPTKAVKFNFIAIRFQLDQCHLNNHLCTYDRMGVCVFLRIHFVFSKATNLLQTYSDQTKMDFQLRIPFYSNSTKNKQCKTILTKPMHAEWNPRASNSNQLNVYKIEQSKQLHSFSMKTSTTTNNNNIYWTFWMCDPNTLNPMFGRKLHVNQWTI